MRQIARQRASPFAGYGAQICDFRAPIFLISRKFLHEVPFAEERKISLAQCIFHGGFRGDSVFPPLEPSKPPVTPLKRPLWGLAAPGVEPPPDKPARKCKHDVPDWAYRSVFHQTRLFGGIFSLSIRPSQPRGKPPLCKGRCPAGAEGLSFPGSWMYSAIWQSVETIPCNPSVSFASSRLKGERSEPEGAAKFILRPGTPARRSRGWGAKLEGGL